MRNLRSPLGAGVVLVFFVLLVPSQSRGQQRLNLTAQPSVEIRTLHDDNLFLSSENQADDSILRISPAMSLQQRWLRGGFSGSYGVDSEHYVHHRELATPVARIRALTNFDYRLGQRLTVVLNTAYLNTNTPSELNTETGLAALRIRARRVSAGSSGRYRLSLRSTAVAAYQATTDSLEDGREVRERVGSLSIERRLTQRDLLTLDYEGSRYGFHSSFLGGLGGFGGSGRPAGSQAVRVGWTRNLDARTRFELRAGPRMTERSRTLDLRTLLTHRLEAGLASVSYEQSQTTVIGHASPVAIQNFQARAQWSPVPSLTSSVAPGFFRSTQGTRHVTVFRIAFDARYAVTRSVAVNLAYGADTQRGGIGSFERGADELRHRTFSIGLITLLSSRPHR